MTLVIASQLDTKPKQAKTDNILPPPNPEKVNASNYDANLKPVIATPAPPLVESNHPHLVTDLTKSTI